MPIITKPTRTADHTSTLIDHIYANVPQKIIKSGISLIDITDHLPVFCTVATKLTTVSETRLFRDFSHFNEAEFLKDIEEENTNYWISDNVNESMNKLVSSLLKITEKHAPLRKVPSRKRRLLKSPWISSAILISIKKKHKLFKSYFLSKSPKKVKYYSIIIS